ncbi:hypothetical protein [Solemya velum gill symbiont]|uniref:hypothetical protein n=1 Tax=Solemya velum gill symbiont TaxID=2340 RepID=UPI0015C3AD1E|nr:hypothetical protein [Solemya velum gill symbiont]
MIETLLMVMRGVVPVMPTLALQVTGVPFQPEVDITTAFPSLIRQLKNSLGYR